MRLRAFRRENCRKKSCRKKSCRSENCRKENCRRERRIVGYRSESFTYRSPGLIIV